MMVRKAPFCVASRPRGAAFLRQLPAQPSAPSLGETRRVGWSIGAVAGGHAPLGGCQIFFTVFVF